MTLRSAWRPVVGVVVAATVGFLAALTAIGSPTATVTQPLTAPPGRGDEPPWWETITVDPPDPHTDRATPRTYIIPGDVLFGIDSAAIDTAGKATLMDMAHQNLRDATTVTVSGTTDGTGSRPHNLLLSQMRADAAKAVLVEAGIPPDIILTEAWANDRPIGDEHGPDPATARALNRRVEIAVTSRSTGP